MTIVRGPQDQGDQARDRRTTQDRTELGVTGRDEGEPLDVGLSQFGDLLTAAIGE